MRLVDWIVLCVTLGLVVAHGLWRSPGSSDLNQYTLAGRSMPWYAVALSVMATASSHTLQMLIMTAGLAAALICAVLLLPSHVSFGDAVTLAGAVHSGA